MKKIALFGGTFDPPHLGHVLTITALLNSESVDEVWVVPVGDDRIDKVPVTSGHHRRAMVECMLAECFSGEPVRLEPIQLDGKLPGSYTVDLLKFLKSKNQADEFAFVIGADNALKVKDWKEGNWLWDNARFIVMPRLGEPQPTGLPQNFTILPVSGYTHTNASSSTMRENLKLNAKLNGIVPQSVQGYIRKNSIYREKN